MPFFEPSPEKQLLPAGQEKSAEEAPPSLSSRRRVLTAAVAASAIAVAGYAYWIAPADHADPDDKLVFAAIASHTVMAPVRVDLNNPRELQEARASLDLPPAAAEKLIADVKQAATIAAATSAPALSPGPAALPLPLPIAQTAKPNLELAWLTLSDFLDEDGDAVQISTGGLTRTILLRKTPTVIAVPLVSGDFLRVTGMRDGGGGGVTVAIQAGGPEVKLILDEGQTITMPLK
jgi:hypothetical protein